MDTQGRLTSPGLRRLGLRCRAASGSRLHRSHAAGDVVSIAVISLAVAAGCLGGEDRQGPQVVVRDSAGVQIIESRAPLWANGETWVVSDSPVVRIGAVHGRETEEFFLISSVRGLPGGRILVANSGTSEVRFYDDTGAYQFSFGREGGGPGEFRGLKRVFPAGGDTLIVTDISGTRAFDQAGNPLAGMTDMARNAVHRFADGRFLLITYADRTNLTMSGLARDTMAVVLIGPGTQQDTVLYAAGSARFILAHESGLTNYDAPFGPRLSVAADSGSFFIGDGSDGFVIAEHDLHGGKLRVLSRPAFERPVTDDAIARLLGQLRASTPEGLHRARLERAISSWDYPARLPAYDRLVVDESGHVWARNYPLPEDSVAVWSVLDRTRGWLGDVRLPVELEVFDIVDGKVLGVRRGAGNVEYVEVFGVTRPNM